MVDQPLNALVPPRPDRHFQRIEGKICLQVISDLPAQNAAGEQVHHERGIHEIRGDDGHVRDVRHPAAIRRGSVEAAFQLAKGDHAFAHNNFVAALSMPAFVSGIFRVGFSVFMLGALVAGVGWIGIYVGLSYFLGAEIAKRIGDAGTKAVLGVVVIVAIGLGIKAGVSKWHAIRQERSAGQGPPA